MKPTAAAIDIGSNAIRMIIGHPTELGLEILGKYRMPVRLGKDVFLSGTISPHTTASAIDCFNRFKAVTERDQINKIRVVATSALREALNQKEFCAQVAKETGLQIEVITGIEEARLIYMAISKEIDLLSGRNLLIDIGGGSVELTITSHGQVQAAQSFPMGTVRMLNMLQTRNLKENHINVIIGEFIPAISDFFETHLGAITPEISIGTGGNFEAIAALKPKLLRAPSSQYLTLKNLVDITQIVSSLSLQERQKHLGMKPDRADVIIPALYLIKAILRQAGCEKLHVPGVGLRDGILWSMFES